jgi:hypothetical protein
MGSMHDGRHGSAAAEEPDSDVDDVDPTLTAELGRRLDALVHGQAGTVSRAEMKNRLARRRASRLAR